MLPYPKRAGNMNNPTALHHVEMCVSNGQSLASYFTDKLGFSLRACRNTPVSKQWVVGSQKAVFLVTQRLTSKTTTEPVEFSHFCCKGNHSVDSVFNVALEVKDVDVLTAKMQKRGAKLLRPVTEISDSLGSVRYSVMGSCCGNIVHTLLDKSQYKGGFLPTFNTVNSKPTNQEIITHMDHITYVCHPGESSSIINWYQDCLGMEKFKVNPTEDPNEGMVIRGNVGMRLRVIDYWPCAEAGIWHPNGNEETSFKIVLAESLQGQGIYCNGFSFSPRLTERISLIENTHISAFLNGHGGPGLQHIGLHTPCITQCVDYMALRNVLFRKSPAAYYKNVRTDLKNISKSLLFYFHVFSLHASIPILVTFNYFNYISRKCAVT